MHEKISGDARVQAVSDEDEEVRAEIPLDVAVNEPLTWKSFLNIVSKPYTWLPALAYMTTCVLVLFLALGPLPAGPPPSLALLSFILARARRTSRRHRAHES